MGGWRIVIASWGSYGDVNPYVGLARGLRARGHDAVLATPAYFRGYVEGAGVGFHPLRPDVDPHRRDVVARIMDPARGTQFIFQELLLPALGEMYDDLAEAARGADLLVTHPVTFPGPILAQERGIPWLSTVLAPMSFFSAHDLPVFPPIPWLRPLVAGSPRVSAALVRMVKAATRKWTAPVQAFRASRGLPPGGDPVFEGQHSPGGVLGLFSRVLAEPQPDWPPNVHVTGPILYNGPQDAALPPGLARFLDQGPPPVVFTLGTSAVGAAGDFYHESAEALRRTGMRGVLLVGPHPENRPGKALPEGVMAVEFAAHAALFPRASIVVHQGGAGTLHQGLASGQPTLVVPFAHDQPDNADRVARLGVSRTLRPRRYRAARVAALLREMAEDGEMRARAAAVGATVRAEDGVAHACDVIEARLREG